MHQTKFASSFFRLKVSTDRFALKVFSIHRITTHRSVRVDEQSALIVYDFNHRFAKVDNSLESKLSTLRSRGA